MILLHNISPQDISWVKSNKEAFEANGANIRNLYYPEAINELVEIVRSFYFNRQPFVIIGYSSNTLFLPSFSAENVICTKKMNQWKETEDEIICECGTNVSKLAKEMVKKGYVGFEGLTDLPGTLAAGVYGNCGCRGCTVNNLLKYIEVLSLDGSIKIYNVEDLKLRYRSSSLKRGELDGVILRICLKIVHGNVRELLELSEQNHIIRKKFQPSGVNNLGTTFIGNSQLTLKGKVYGIIERIIEKILRINDKRVSYSYLLKITGNGRFVPYVYYWNRYMFIDAKSHLLFKEYEIFLKSLYNDVHLEIEIKE